MNPINKISYLIIELIDKYIHRRKILYLLKKVIKKPEYIVDIGAHKGNYTDLFLLLNINSTIILFEPNNYLYKKLLSKFKKNKKIFIFNYGIGQKNCYQNFFINQNSDYVSSFARVNVNSKYLLLRNILFGSFTNQTKKEKIVIKKLNTIPILKKIKVDLVKIDVEGYEEKVIDGANLTLKRTSVILIEFHKDKMYLDYNYNKIHKKLLKLNFKLFKIIKFPLMSWEDRIYCKNK